MLFRRPLAPKIWHRTHMWKVSHEIWISMETYQLKHGMGAYRNCSLPSVDLDYIISVRPICQILALQSAVHVALRMITTTQSSWVPLDLVLRISLVIFISLFPTLHRPTWDNPSPSGPSQSSISGPTILSSSDHRHVYAAKFARGSEMHGSETLYIRPLPSLMIADLLLLYLPCELFAHY